MKIYTKVGDDGTTGLFGGGRVPKDHPRVSAYGDVDELNAALGLARADCTDAELQSILSRLQNQLFDLGGELATPSPKDAPKPVPVVSEPEIEQMEHEIDHFDEELEPLRAFILPAGTRLSADLHLARTICRRAERAAVALAHHDHVPEAAIRFLNRLSDLLFTLARVANHRAGTPEVKWEPNRKKATAGS
jgi:cob(I)alamin adenosyltransferase